jgi:hypothetical protein
LPPLWGWSDLLARIQSFATAFFSLLLYVMLCQPMYRTVAEDRKERQSASSTATAPNDLQ